MLARATLRDPAGFLFWPGQATTGALLNSAPLLDEFQAATPLARLARLILTDKALRLAYGPRAQKLYDFVKTHVVDKRLTVYEAEAALRANASLATDPRGFDDSTSAAIRLLLDLHRTVPEPRYADLAHTLAAGFTARLLPFAAGALIWDTNSSGLFAGARVVPLTLTANRQAAHVLDCLDAGGVGGLTAAHLQGLARLLTTVIWDQSLTSPRFTNYIDRDNSPVGPARGPWRGGDVSAGWLALGARNAAVQQVGEATLDALVRGVSNPSLDAQRDLGSLLHLAGTLTRNRRLLGWELAHTSTER